MKRQLFTLMLLSAGAWSILQVGHEIIGHGLAMLLVGGKPISVNAMFFYGDLSEVSEVGERWVKAGGSLFNIIWAALCLCLLHINTFKRFEVNYFLWVSSIINFMQSGSYIAFGRFINDGMDWVMILDGLDNKVFWGNIEMIVGIGFLILGTFIGYQYGKRFYKFELITSTQKLYWIPLFTSTIVSVTSSFIMPTDHRFMMVMGGIGNGFTFLLPLFILGFIKKREVSPFPFENKPIIGLQLFTVAISVFYLFFMSPGISF